MEDATLSDEEIGKVAHVLHAIAHPVRLKIFLLLVENERRVLDIVSATLRGRTNISQHLGKLRNKGIIETRTEGGRVFYRLSDAGITPRLAPIIRQVVHGDHHL